MRNTIGTILRLTTFGESHGPAIGGVLDGCPPGLSIDEKTIQKEIDRRKTGTQFYASARIEPDKIELISGIAKGLSTGAPIAFIVRNQNARPSDYDHLKGLYRPSHADFSWEQKYGPANSSGGGRSSARTLLPCVVAGTIAQGILKRFQCSVTAWVSAIGPHIYENKSRRVSLRAIESSPVRCPDIRTSEKMIRYLKDLHASGDTAGGIITCRISGCPAGLGEPSFGKLHAMLAHAMMNINSVKGFEYGSGFSAAGMKGSKHNDAFIFKNGHIGTATNHDGGIQGGISNGEDIILRVAFKPVSSIGMKQETVNKEGKRISITIKGRHDTCVVPRAVPIVEAMARLIIADHYLMQETRKFS